MQHDGGVYLKKAAAFPQVWLRALRAMPMVWVRLWHVILLAALFKVLPNALLQYLGHHHLIWNYLLPVAIIFMLLQFYLWSVVLVGINHILSGFSAFSVKSCYSTVYRYAVRVFLVLAGYLLWLLYAPHLLITLFIWVLGGLGLHGPWQVMVAAVVASFIVLSGVITYIFMLPFILIDGKKVPEAFTMSAELTSTNWIYVVVVLAFCVIINLFVQPNTMLFRLFIHHYLSYGMDIIFSFLLYSFFITLILHLLKFVILRTPEEVRKQGKIRLR